MARRWLRMPAAAVTVWMVSASIRRCRVIYLYNELNAYKQKDRDDESMVKAVEFLSDDAFRKVSIYYASLVPPGPAAPTATSDGDQSTAEAAAADPVQLGQAAVSP